MGRWTQYDEDSYRLPEGVTRTGYDADTGRYLFNGAPGIPYTRYGVVTPGQERVDRSRAGGDRLQLRREPLVLPIYPSRPNKEPSEDSFESNSKPINIPNIMRALRRAVLAPFAFSRRRSEKRLAELQPSTTDPDPKAEVEGPVASGGVPRTNTSKRKPDNHEKQIQPAVGPPKKTARSASLHIRSTTDNVGASTSSPHSSRSPHHPREHRRASESHAHPFFRDSKDKSSSSSAVLQPSHRSSSILTPKPVNTHKSYKPTQMESENLIKPSGVVLTRKKLDVTEMPTHTPSQSKLSKSTTLPTRRPPHSATSFPLSTKESLPTPSHSLTSPPDSSALAGRVFSVKPDTKNPVSRTRSYPARARSRTEQTPPRSSVQAVGSTRHDALSPRPHTSSKSQTVDP